MISDLSDHSLSCVPLRNLAPTREPTDVVLFLATRLGVALANSPDGDGSFSEVKFMKDQSGCCKRKKTR